MKIDRSLFLVLAGALAATACAACQVYVGDEHPKAPPPPPPPPQAANQSTPPAIRPAQPAAPTKIVPLHLAHPGGATPAPTPSGGTTPPSPATCLDTGASTVPSCTSLPAADSSCSTNAVPQQKCAAYAAYFDAKVAASAISCMAGMPSRTLCDATQSTNCGHTALAQACPDSTLSQLCSIAATSCKSNASDCTALLSGLNDNGKQQVAQCIAQGCQSGLSACVDALTAPTASSALRR